jgi:hypothetical protein
MLSQRVVHFRELARRKFAEFTTPNMQEASSTGRGQVEGSDVGSISRAGAADTSAGSGISAAVTEKLNHIARLLNSTTGYNRIERLREGVANADQELSRSREHAKRMKQVTLIPTSLGGIAQPGCQLVSSISLCH